MITQTTFNVPLHLIEEANNSISGHDFRIAINEPTGNFFYDPWTIKEEYKGTVWDEILNTLPVDHGEARIIQLKHGTCYMSHADIDDRYHLSLQGQYSYLIDIDSKEMHEVLCDGMWSLMNTGVRHVAANFGSIMRNQLVVRKLLNKSDSKNAIGIKIEPICENPRFEFDDIISPWLNTMNKKNLLKDFQASNSGVYFQIDKNYLGDLDYFPRDKFFIETIV